MVFLLEEIHAPFSRGPSANAAAVYNGTKITRIVIDKLSL